MDSLLMGLNEEQKQAVTTTEGYVRVIAGAGSGKTKALTNRFAYIVRELGIPPSNIMSVTFTNKAAGEMKKRIRALIGENDTGFISTFHGFCARFLRDEIHHLNYPKKHMILDVEDQKSILKEIIVDDLNLSLRDFKIRWIIDFIEKTKFKTQEEYIELVTGLNLSPLIYKDTLTDDYYERIFYRYLIKQRKNFALDFNDLLYFTVYVLLHNEDVLNNWQSKLNYIQVDEFQDVSETEHRLVDLLSQKYKNLFVVGDPDQTIYSWRGASIKFILNFDKYFRTAKTINMNLNYRSSPEILSVANSLISHNKLRFERDLIANKKCNLKVTHFHAKCIQEEAEWISKRIKQLLSDGADPSNIVILYRSHHVSRYIEESLMNFNILYTIYNGVEFYARKEIKDALCYLRFLVFNDDISFLRIINSPKRNIGKVKIELLKEFSNKHNLSLYEGIKKIVQPKFEYIEDYSQIDSKLLISKFTNTGASKFVTLIEKYRSEYKNQKVTVLLDNLLKESGYELELMSDPNQDRLDNIAELKQSIQYYEDTAGEEVSLEDYLEKIALYTDKDKNEKQPTIKLMTVHAAKGLEYKFVFVCSLNEGVFPSSRARDRKDMEEERRLAYVAFTRAEDELYLSDSEGFNFITNSDRYPSRFIFNIDDKLLEFQGEISEELIKRAAEFIDEDEDKLDLKEQDELTFKVSDKVIHKHFGNGVIIEILDKENFYSVKFNECEQLRNISMDFPGLALIEDESPSPLIETDIEKPQTQQPLEIS